MPSRAAIFVRGGEEQVSVSGVGWGESYRLSAVSHQPWRLPLDVAAGSSRGRIGLSFER